MSLLLVPVFESFHGAGWNDTHKYQCSQDVDTWKGMTAVAWGAPARPSLIPTVQRFSPVLPLPRAHLDISEDIFVSLQTAGERNVLSYLVGQGQRCCSTSYGTQNRLYHKEGASPKYQQFKNDNILTQETYMEHQLCTRHFYRHHWGDSMLN